MDNFCDKKKNICKQVLRHIFFLIFFCLVFNSPLLANSDQSVKKSKQCDVVFGQTTKGTESPGLGHGTMVDRLKNLVTKISRNPIAEARAFRSRPIYKLIESGVLFSKYFSKLVESIRSNRSIKTKYNLDFPFSKASDIAKLDDSQLFNLASAIYQVSEQVLSLNAATKKLQKLRGLLSNPDQSLAVLKEGTSLETISDIVVGLKVLGALDKSYRLNPFRLLPKGKTSSFRKKFLLSFVAIAAANSYLMNHTIVGPEINFWLFLIINGSATYSVKKALLPTAKEQARKVKKLIERLKIEKSSNIFDVKNSSESKRIAEAHKLDLANLQKLKDSIVTKVSYVDPLKGKNIISAAHQNQVYDSTGVVTLGDHLKKVFREMSTSHADSFLQFNRSFDEFLERFNKGSIKATLPEDIDTVWFERSFTFLKTLRNKVEAENSRLDKEIQLSEQLKTNITELYVEINKLLSSEDVKSPNLKEELQLESDNIVLQIKVMDEYVETNSHIIDSNLAILMRLSLTLDRFADLVETVRDQGLVLTENKIEAQKILKAFEVNLGVKSPDSIGDLTGE